MSEEKRKEILKVKEIEDERESIMKNFEEDMKNLELKYDKLLVEVSQRKIAKMSENKDLFNNYWLRVLSNHKITKDFIAEDDKEALKHLKNIKSVKLDDGNVFSYLILVF
jgi:hypothetical protein